MHFLHSQTAQYSPANKEMKIVALPYLQVYASTFVLAY